MHLLIERFETEKSSGLVGIVLYGPDVAGIDEHCALEHPEQLVAVFEIQHKRYVAALVDEVCDVVA